MRRGEIWWACLPTPRGSEPGFRRPVVIVQSDAFNRSTIRTVMVTPLTSNLFLADAPGNVKLGRRVTGLPKPSVANVSQVLTIDRSYLTEKVKGLPDGKLREIESGLRIALGL
jgi:mRNA interferase MazF